MIIYDPSTLLRGSGESYLSPPEKVNGIIPVNRGHCGGHYGRRRKRLLNLVDWS